MEEDFWLERWQRGATGFHQPDVHAALPAYWHKLRLDAGDAVFVPMCGKTRDMLWMREHGHHVLGVELSPIAVESFYAENGMQPTHIHRDSFDVSEADGIRILCGNFFDVTANDVKETRAVYDRAALVALPAPMREAYATHMMQILPLHTRMLLITLDYPAGQMEGPPFAVGPDEVARLYEARAGKIDLLRREDVLSANPAFSTRGLTGLYENTFLIELS